MQGTVRGHGGVAATENEVPKENVGTTETEEPEKEGVQGTSFVIKPEDEEILVTYFGADFKDKLLEFHQSILAKPTAKPAVFGSLLTPPITDRVLRGRMHGDVRRIFESRLETEVGHVTSRNDYSKTCDFHPKPTIFH